jgi:2-oxoisovalerate dehydrogenase E1 component
MPTACASARTATPTGTNSTASEEELAEARRRDPLLRLRAFVLTEGICNDEEISAIEAENMRLLDEESARAEAAPDPDPATVRKFVFADDTHVCPLSNEKFESPHGKARGRGSDPLTLREAINRTLIEEFRRNPEHLPLGTGRRVGDKGGVFNVTKGMQQEFGSGRVFNAPIAEDFILGTANGFCRYSDDIWVVVEGAEFADYFWPAMEQMVNTAHEHWRSNGQFAPNIIVRLASGGYIQGGLYHSQSIEARWQTYPACASSCPPLPTTRRDCCAAPSARAA